MRWAARAPTVELGALSCTRAPQRFVRFHAPLPFHACFGNFTSRSSPCAFSLPAGAAPNCHSPHIALGYFIPPALLSGRPHFRTPTVFAPEREIDVVPACDKVWRAIAIGRPQIRSVHCNLSRQPLRLELFGLELTSTGGRGGRSHALSIARADSLGAMLASTLHET